MMQQHVHSLQSVNLFCLSSSTELSFEVYLTFFYTFQKLCSLIFEQKTIRKAQFVKQRCKYVIFLTAGNIHSFIQLTKAHTFYACTMKANNSTLGQTRCLIVNNLELIREVLNQNGKFFGGRPDFLRYHKIFGGDRNNSLALCDWSPLQQQRRYLGRRYFSPRDSTKFFKRMSEIGQLVTTEFLSKLDKLVVPNEDFELKPYIQRACANMFLQYMSSSRFEYEDKNFQKIVEYFDEVFWEINEGYAVDFLPWLSPIYKRHFDRLEDWSRTVRNFILEATFRICKKTCNASSDFNLKTISSLLTLYTER